jgi:PilZ domain
METTRRVPRYLFTAPAEVVPENSAAPFSVSVKELSLYGCYLDTAAPLNTKTRVLLKVFGADEFFEANATVIYAHPRLGMGLAFHDVKPHFLVILRKWLLLAMQDRKEPNA